MLFAIREGWASGGTRRTLAQAAIALLLVSGTYVVSRGADGKLADRIAPESTQALKGDRQPVLRPATPESAKLELAALAEPAPSPPVAPVAVLPPKPPAEAPKPRKAQALPAGVERYDSCRAPCDSRDPLVRRSDAPAKLALAEPAAPVQTPPVPAAATPAPDGGGLLAGTVSGTQAAIGKLQQAMQTVVDVVW
ncbi:MAG TPA: hypothetical protein VLA00_11620 [Xanthobacteraceae bacterium]|nr:hypothetical protein [Xanthobacteraceae bacterium]